MADIRQRFYLLDILRGLASLTVVVWHYQHFFFIAPETLPLDFDRSQQPFYWILFPFYEQGLRAVQLFFALSVVYGKCVLFRRAN